MQTLKQRISADFISAFKSGDSVKKNLLSVIKGEITTIEKNTNSTELSDTEIMKILLKTQKNLKETLTAQDSDEVRKELEIVESYLPSQMTDEEIRKEVSEILLTLPASLPLNARIGKAMGEFTKKNQGRADSSVVNSIIKEQVEA